MIGRTNAGGGGTGATLTVNAPAGVSVIATNTATSRAYTRTANSNGVAVFKGLPTGTYFVHITDGATTSEDFTANIIADYELTVNSFAAYINASYPPGSTCTCSDGNISLAAPDTTGNCTFVVPNAGTWTISCHWPKYDLNADESVTIAADGEEKTAKPVFKLYLCKPGDQCTAVTGGWKQLSQYGDLSFTSKGLKITQSGDQRSYYGCASFDPSTMADFNTLKATLASVERVQGNTSCSLQIAPNNTVPSGTFPSVSTTADVLLGDKGSYSLGTKSISLSAIDSGYPRICNYYWTFVLSYIWLET